MMKINEVRAPKDGEHPIMYDLIRHWMSTGKQVIINSDGFMMYVKSIEVDLQHEEAPRHGQRRTYKVVYQHMRGPRGKKPAVLSTDIENTWMYPAELEDAKLVEKTDTTVTIWTPDYLSAPDKMKLRRQ